VVTRLYIERMERVGLSVAQFTLLAAIGSNPGVRAADLAPALDLEKSTVSRELAALTAEGHVLIEPLGGRSQGLSLSETGAAVLAEAFPAWEEAQAAARQTLGELGDALLTYFPAR
jgi:DNA-binding MarR family transcriptional regulator